jgi:hypothetical protein
LRKLDQGQSRFHSAVARGHEELAMRMGRKFGFPGEKLIPWQLWMTMLKHIPS